MADAWIVVYGHPPNTPTNRMNKLRQELYGYTDRSNQGQYQYERPGLLTGKPYILLKKGVLVVPYHLGPEIQLLLARHDVWTWIRRVQLEPEDSGILDKKR